MKHKDKGQERWISLRTNNSSALKGHIRDIFRKHDHQENVLIDLYKMVFPDWDRIKKIEGFPEAGSALWKFICDRFMDFDRKHHPDCLKGGAWMNSGFSASSQLDPWEISLDNCKVIMD